MLDLAALRMLVLLSSGRSMSSSVRCVSTERGGGTYASIARRLKKGCRNEVQMTTSMDFVNLVITTFMTISSHSQFKIEPDEQKIRPLNTSFSSASVDVSVAFV